MIEVVPFSEDFTEIIELRNHKKAVLRLLRSTDESLMLDFFKSCTKECIFNRFMSSALYNNIRKEDSQYVMNLIRKYLDLDLKNHMSIVAVIREENKEKIVAEGRFFRIDKDRAEVALITRDNWQRLGLGTSIANLLKNVAISRGIKIFEGDILLQNEKMLNVFRSLKIKYSRVLNYNTIHFEIQLDDPYYN
ncbi:MAG: GNAT family N-acetyltransferase [Candidatus Helarchaeota archaeon]